MLRGFHSAIELHRAPTEFREFPKVGPKLSKKLRLKIDHREVFGQRKLNEWAACFDRAHE